MGSPNDLTTAVTRRNPREHPATRWAALVGLVGVFALTACSDDGDDESSTISAGPDTCVAYTQAADAGEQLASVDVLTADQAELRDALDGVTASVTNLSEVAGIDDEGLLEDIEAVVAEIPPGMDPEQDQLDLIALSDARDIIAADVNLWLDDSGIACG
jgi:hypothetical protein